MKIYISGSITDGGSITDPKEIKARERDFFVAAEHLEKVGLETINPARVEGREDCKSWLDFMRAALRDLADADGLAMLPGWERSRGARIEAEISMALGLPARMLADWVKDPQDNDREMREKGFLP